MCTYTPYQELQFFFFRFKLWHLGVFLVLWDLLQLPMSNPGGRIAHLGGALWGFIYAKQLLAGNDIAAWFSNVMDWSRTCLNLEVKDLLKRYIKTHHLPSLT